MVCFEFRGPFGKNIKKGKKLIMEQQQSYAYISCFFHAFQALFYLIFHSKFQQDGI